MKRVLILGASGMAGHVVYGYLRSLNGKYETGATTRKLIEGIESLVVDVEENLSDLAEIIKVAEADAIVNCIGLLVKPCEDCPAEAVYINSFFPQMLANITQDTKTKIIHLSSDCIYDGTIEDDKGYDEKYIPDEQNWYGRTKALGEINNKKDLTLRMSIIGPELKDGVGLFHWFSKQKGKVNGYVNHYWNGITTLELAKQIDRIIDTELSGIYNLIHKEPIAKYDLLNLIKKVFEYDVEVEKFETEIVNKVLSNNRISEYNPLIPDYETQLVELKKFIS